MSRCEVPDRHHSDDIIEVYSGEVEPFVMCGWHTESLSDSISRIRRAREGGALDVWIRESNDSDFEPDASGRYNAEANTFYLPGAGYRVEWYLSAVGLVMGVHFDTLADAYDWLEREGFSNYAS